MQKKKIAVLFGGQSSEHIVSCMSAANIIEQIDTSKYEPLLIGITEDGHSALSQCPFRGMEGQQDRSHNFPRRHKAMRDLNKRFSKYIRKN